MLYVVWLSGLGVVSTSIVGCLLVIPCLEYQEKNNFSFLFFLRAAREGQTSTPPLPLTWICLTKKKEIYIYTYAFRESVLLELIGLEVFCGEEREELSFLSKSCNYPKTTQKNTEMVRV